MAHWWVVLAEVVARVLAERWAVEQQRGRAADAREAVPGPEGPGGTAVGATKAVPPPRGPGQ